MRILLLDEAQLRVGNYPIVNVSVMLSFCVLIMCVHTWGWLDKLTCTQISDDVMPSEIV